MSRKRSKHKRRYYPHEQFFVGDLDFPGEDTFERLYFIYRKRDKGKMETDVSYKYRKYLGSRLKRLAKRLDDESWKPYGTNKFYTRHPKREINAPYYEDRIVEYYLDYFYLIPFSEPHLINNNNACRVGKGMTDGNRKIRDAILELSKSNPCFYVVQTDIKGYFDNLKHDYIKDLFKGLDPHAYTLLLKILGGWHKSRYVDEDGVTHDVGVPKGCVVSQRIGVVALNSLDHRVSSWDRCLFYIRIMDDILVFVANKDDAKECLKMMRNTLEEKDMGLNLHPTKTQYYPFKPMNPQKQGKNNKNRGVVFCGWRYHLMPDGSLSVTVRDSTKDNFKLKMKRLQKEVENGEILAKKAEISKQCCINYLKGSKKQGLSNDTVKLQRYIDKRYDFKKAQETFLTNQEEKTHGNR